MKKISIDPQQNLIGQLQTALKKHPSIEVDLTSDQIKSFLPQIIHQALADRTIRSYIDGVFLKNTQVTIEQSNLSFSVQAVLDFVGHASFLGRNKIAIIKGSIGMKGERAVINSLSIDIPNLGFFQKGMFAAAKSTIIQTATKTDLNEALILALQQEELPVKQACLKIQHSIVQITMEKTKS